MTAAMLLLGWIGMARVAQGVEIPEVQLQNKKCLDCHSRSSIAQMPPEQRRQQVAPGGTPSTEPVRPGLFVTDQSLKGSVHANLTCVSCHEQGKQLPHAASMPQVSCNNGCHVTENAAFRKGTHAEALARGDDRAPTCVTCHGGHDVEPKASRNSRINPLNIVQTCANCHQQYQETPNGTDGRANVANYLESVHGKAVTKGGLVVAATCADCHRPHDVRPASDPESSVHRSGVPQTCGRCHVTVSETYQHSIHGQLLAAGSEEAPTCTGCHTAHQITRSDTPRFQLDLVAQCGTCHSKLYDTYRKSYHGQVTKLGFERAARCSSCHGSHDITRVEDPDSRLAADQRVQTCATGANGEGCHARASAGFATFIAHADYRDRQKYPVLYYIWLYFVIMMSFAFGFFGLHSLLWLARSLIERLRHGAPPSHHGHGPAIQRFNRVDRANHALVIISFFGLTLTGLPLLYSDKAWAQWLMSMMGEVEQAKWLHRFFAIILIGNFVVHGVGVARRIRKYGFFKLLLGPTTMLPRWKDVTDCLGMFRWFFIGGKKPAFDRWTYWEKFDYVAEVGGSMIIGITGLLLWYPQFFGQFLPGWWFNVASLIHGYEALLAIGFIFTIHFFNAHLRLEKFPVDDVMFTGRLSEEEFKEERYVEYARLLESGQLDSLRVKPAPPGYRHFAVTVGILAMAVGTTLVALIVLAGLGVI